MCGIVAIFSPNRPIAPETLQRATDRLRHRGPDGEGQWMSSDRKAALGHRRLSIIDLTTGDQPIASEDGRTHIIVNGEFYGYEATQRELEQAGHRLRTRSDSEIALHLYEDLGPQCLSRLRGEFAFVLWDDKSRTLFAARDRFGIKPLYYAWHEGALYLASEVKALFAAGVPARWDGESLYNAFASIIPQTRTLFAGVFQVPPGHHLIATDKQMQVSQYWDFDFPRAETPEPRRSDADWVAEFRHLLDEAVRIRLRADVPVACYLSGGIDSCAVLGLAARHQPRPIRAFTLTFDQPEYDEGEIAREMAVKAGAEFTSIHIRQEDLADNLADAIEHVETLCVNAHGVAKYLLSRTVRDAGYKVVITGEGSDEILGGYAFFQSDMEQAERGGPSANGETGEPDAVKRLLGFTPAWMEAITTASKGTRSVMTPALLERKVGRENFHAFVSEIDMSGRLAGRHPLNQSLYLWSKTVLPTYILTMLGDRMEMAHSVEGRLPFLDHHLVEAMCAQPISQKIRGRTEKYVLREATRDVISDVVYKRPKQQFLSPPATLLRKDKLYALVRDTLRGPALAALPYFNQRKVVGFLQWLDSMDEAALALTDRSLMRLTSACILQERFKLSV